MTILPRVIIADDHELARAGLRTVLERSGLYDVVADAPTAEAALHLCAEIGRASCRERV